MIFYTSASNRMKNYYLLFTVLLMFSIAVFVGQELTNKFPNAKLNIENVNSMIRPDSSNYLAYYYADIDHYILYHDIYNSIQNAKNADILFIGNSRSQFGFNSDFFRNLSKKEKIKFFNLSFGVNENEKFFSVLFEKYNLRPKIVILNLEGFFDRDPTSLTEAVLDSNLFDAYKIIFETNMTFKVMSFIHRVIPLWVNKEVSFGVTRNIEDGWWTVGEYIASEKKISHGGFPVKCHSDKEWSIPKDTFQKASDFTAMLKDRGIEVIYTWVPASGDVNLPAINSVVKHLNVPLISILCDGLLTFDGAHLTKESSEVFSERFWREFKKLKKSLY